MLLMHLDHRFCDALSAHHSPYEMGAWVISGQVRKQWGSFGNYMLAARKGDAFIENCHNGYKELWKGRTNAEDFHKILTMSDNVAQMLVGDRTRNLLDASTGWNGRDFFNGKAMELLTTPLDEPDAKKKQAAEDFVVEMREKSHRYKVFHNSVGGLPALGDRIKRDEFRDADPRPGTSGEMCRYKTVHWESKRAVELLSPEETGEDLICATPTLARQETG
ncbi:unnamed protein product [Diplocarpon coronariae]